MKLKFVLPALSAVFSHISQAQTIPPLQSVTEQGNTTDREVIAIGSGARFVMKGNDFRWIQWRSNANTEDAWVGFGEQGSNWFGMRNALGSIYLLTSGIFDVRARTLVNAAVDDQVSALQVNGNVRLSHRGHSYVVRDFATMGETVSGAATVIGNNAITNTNVAERVDYAYPTLDGSNAMVMSYNKGTMFHVKPSGIHRNAGDKWFSVGDGTDEVMRLTPGQRVLIGTIIDDNTHKLQVNGFIKTRKIKVTEVGWADFVFEPGYQLPSLHDLERYIREHRRLPGIPSEKEVRENGIDLGDMNKRLLQKVEEQALYIIELNKQVEQMRKEMGDLRQRFEKGSSQVQPG